MNIEVAENRGRIEGKKEGREEVAQSILIDNEAITKIIKFTGLTSEKIEEIKAKLEKSK